MLIWTSHEVASRDGTGAGAGNAGAGAGAPDLLDGEDTSTCTPAGRSAATADVTGLVSKFSASSAAADCGTGLGGWECDDGGIFMYVLEGNEIRICGTTALRNQCYAPILLLLGMRSNENITTLGQQFATALLQFDCLTRLVLALDEFNHAEDSRGSSWHEKFGCWSDG